MARSVHRQSSLRTGGCLHSRSGFSVGGSSRRVAPSDKKQGRAGTQERHFSEAIRESPQKSACRTGQQEPLEPESGGVQQQRQKQQQQSTGRQQTRAGSHQPQQIPNPAKIGALSEEQGQGQRLQQQPKQRQQRQQQEKQQQQQQGQNSSVLELQGHGLLGHINQGQQPQQQLQHPKLHGCSEQGLARSASALLGPRKGRSSAMVHPRTELKLLPADPGGAGKGPTPARTEEPCRPEAPKAACSKSSALPRSQRGSSFVKGLSTAGLPLQPRAGDILDCPPPPPPPPGPCKGQRYEPGTSPSPATVVAGPPATSPSAPPSATVLPGSRTVTPSRTAHASTEEASTPVPATRPPPRRCLSGPRTRPVHQAGVGGSQGQRRWGEGSRQGQGGREGSRSFCDRAMSGCRDEGARCSFSEGIRESRQGQGSRPFCDRAMSGCRNERSAAGPSAVCAKCRGPCTGLCWPGPSAYKNKGAPFGNSGAFLATAMDDATMMDCSLAGPTIVIPRKSDLKVAAGRESAVLVPGITTTALLRRYDLLPTVLAQKARNTQDSPHTESPHTESPHTESPHTESPHTESPHAFRHSAPLDASVATKLLPRFHSPPASPRGMRRVAYPGSRSTPVSENEADHELTPLDLTISTFPNLALLDALPSPQKKPVETSSPSGDHRLASRCCTKSFHKSAGVLVQPMQQSATSALFRGCSHPDTPGKGQTPTAFCLPPPPLAESVAVVEGRFMFRKLRWTKPAHMQKSPRSLLQKGA